MITEEVKKQLSGALFTTRKLTDTPTDSLQVVPRKYITRYGTTAQRPTTSVMVEQFYDTTLGKPIWWNGSTWKDASNNTV